MTRVAPNPWMLITLAVWSGALLWACGDDESSGGAGAAAASTTTTTDQGGAAAAAGFTTSSGGQGAGTGASGGNGLTGAGGQGQGGGDGGSGGAAITGGDVCADTCAAMVACATGSGGAGGGGQTLEQCFLVCEPSLVTCDKSQLYEVLGCMTPALDPNCDETAFFECADAVGCVDDG